MPRDATDAVADALSVLPVRDRAAALICSIVEDDRCDADDACRAVLTMISCAGAMAQRLPTSQRAATAFHMRAEASSLCVNWN